MPRTEIIEMCKAMTLVNLLRKTTELNEELNNTIDEYRAMDPDGVAIDHYPPIKVDSSISMQLQREQLITQYVERFELKTHVEVTMQTFQEANNALKELEDYMDSDAFKM